MNHVSLCPHPLSKAFGQFDAEGDGVVDVESMLIALKNSNGANLQGELSHVIRQLQACSLTPGKMRDLFTWPDKAKLVWIQTTNILLLSHKCSKNYLLA